MCQCEIIDAIDLCDAWEHLTPRQREVLELVVCQGYTHKAAAAQLGISPQSARRRHGRAVRRLRRVLSQTDDGCAVCPSADAGTRPAPLRG